jgi:hypothetical protein
MLDNACCRDETHFDNAGAPVAAALDTSVIDALFGAYHPRMSGRQRVNKATAYIATIGALILVATAALASFVVFESRSADHILAKPFASDPSTYRAFSDYPHPEIQDRDVYFHNIGRSIEEARKADIIILGHSVWFYALDDEQIRAFNAKHGLRIFNMASAGNSSGDFIRAVTKRWDIHPRLWVINADDEAVSFFNPGIDDAAAPTGSASSMQIVKTSRAKGFFLAFARNARWRLTDLIGYLPARLQQWIFPRFASRFEAWRSVETGNWLFPAGTVYDGLRDNPFKAPLKSCPVSDAEVSSARGFITDIGGPVVLTLVAYARWCPQRVNDLAQALGVEEFLPPSTDYSNLDGRHMDRRGAKAYTAWFLDALASTREFGRLISDQRLQARADGTTAEVR